jgi:hypothetical protein
VVLLPSEAGNKFTVASVAVIFCNVFECRLVLDFCGNAWILLECNDKVRRTVQMNVKMYLPLDFTITYF